MGDLASKQTNGRTYTICERWKNTFISKACTFTLTLQAISTSSVFNNINLAFSKCNNNHKNNTNIMAILQWRQHRRTNKKSIWKAFKLLSSFLHQENWLLCIAFVYICWKYSFKYFALIFGAEKNMSGINSVWSINF